MSAPRLAELRLLGSKNLDPSTIVTVILCGDRRLETKLRTPDLLPVDSRVRTRLVLEVENADTLGAMLRHVLAAARDSTLMTDELQRTLCEHAAGNRCLLMNLCGDALALVLGVSKNDKRFNLGRFASISASRSS